MSDFVKDDRITCKKDIKTTGTIVGTVERYFGGVTFTRTYYEILFDNSNRIIELDSSSIIKINDLPLQKENLIEKITLLENKNKSLQEQFDKVINQRDAIIKLIDDYLNR
jgi:hypothetical protein